jgi:hypothetical protein
MAQSREYIPKKDANLIVFAKNFYDYALANHVRWGVPSPKEMLEEPIADYESDLAIFNNPNHGKFDAANKNDSKYILLSTLSIYIHGYIVSNPQVNNKDREHLSLPQQEAMPAARPILNMKRELGVLE